MKSRPHDPGLPRSRPRGSSLPRALGRLFRRTRRVAADLLRGEGGGKEFKRILGRSLAQTLDLIPLDARLLMSRKNRTQELNRQLAWSLAFVAGAVNAGGFLAIGAYTSHVTGAVSRMADEVALGNQHLALGALGLLICFTSGAFVASMLISYGRRHRYRGRYALALVIEALLLLAFGFLGATLHQGRTLFLPTTVALLSFLMGMHNSVVTTISSAEVRTTHMTGIVTDIGLELGRLLYVNRLHNARMNRVVADRNRLKLHTLILASFFGGGLVGALGFKHVGYKVTVPLAGFLLFLALRPVVYDLKVRSRLMWRALR